MNATVSLSTPIRIGHLQLKHRMAMAPMGDRMWTAAGAPRPGLYEYYQTKARGGTSLITLGASEFHPGYANGNKLCLANDDNQPQLRRLTDLVHAEGVPIIVQLQHGGPAAVPSVSPSGIPSLSALKGGFIKSRSLTTADVAEMRDRFIDGARRAQKAGFDGVQLAGQAGYLLGQFFSPKTNQRNDAYGGCADNRMRLALEIIEGIRKACGSAFAIGYAISADEFSPDGVVLETCIPFSQRMQDVGLDYLDVRVGTHESFATSAQASAHNRFQPRSGIWAYTECLSQALEIPVAAATHGCYDPARWEDAISRGQASLIQIGKPLLADPALPSKVLQGHPDQIRPCVLCMQCLEPKRFYEPDGGWTFCAVNPEAGAELKILNLAQAQPRRVAIVGGGPAGLEAARVAARRGHQVTLFEQSGRTGGRLQLLARTEGGDLYGQLADWLRNDCLVAGVDLRLNTPVTVDVLRELAPEVVVIATGREFPRAADQPEAGGARVLNVGEALAGDAYLGDDVVIVGADQAGVLTAGALMAKKRARTVTLVDREGGGHIGTGLAHMEQAYCVMAYLPGRQVRARIRAEVVEIQDRAVILRDIDDGRRSRLPANCVIRSGPGEPGYEAILLSRLQEAGMATHVIGDAASPRNLAEVMHEAARVAREI